MPLPDKNNTLIIMGSQEVLKYKVNKIGCENICFIRKNNLNQRDYSKLRYSTIIFFVRQKLLFH